MAESSTKRPAWQRCCGSIPKKTGSEPAFLSGRDYEGFLQTIVKVLAGIAAKANIKE